MTLTDPLHYAPKGDKANSAYFNEYRVKIYERRIKSGLADLLGNMCGLVIQVQTGDALAYLKELCIMTPYRYSKSYINNTHKIYCLVNSNTPNTPVFFVLEPLAFDFADQLTYVNKMYVNSQEKPNARYVGEIFSTKDRNETKKILLSHEIRFQDPDSIQNKFYSNKHIEFTQMSNISLNSLGYTDSNIYDFDSLELGEEFHLSPTEKKALEEVDQFTQEHQIKPLLKGVDHTASRVLAGEREDAILEWLCLSNYYFWGAYDVKDLNSSTNASRITHGNDILSPAKVFTANNTPFMVNSFENLPMPTENFVRNYGRRLHHLAIEVMDGEYQKGTKNIDFVLKKLTDDAHIPFLSQIYGECKDEPNLRQVFSKHSAFSILITEYIERCNNFKGFFTKSNVFALTTAAESDEQIKTHHIGQGVVGD